MPQKPDQRSQQPRDLVAASWHVHYEWTMLNDTAAALTQSDLPNNHRRWAVLESFGLHARALAQFFHPTGRIFGDDILAVHFFPGEEERWQAALGAAPVALNEDVIKALNQEFMHLSYVRLEPDRPTKWPVPAIEAAINVMVATFRETVRPELLHWMWTNNSPSRRPELPGPTAANLAELERAAQAQAQQWAVATTSPPASPGNVMTQCNTIAMPPSVLSTPPARPHGDDK